MNPYAGSFEISTQYQWHFTTFSIELPSDHILEQIYGQIFRNHLRDPKFVSICRLGTPIIKTLLEIHKKIVTDFTPTAIKFHYQFNMRDLTNILGNIMLVKPENVKTPVQLM